MSLPTFTATTTAEEVLQAFADQVKDKNVLITGTSLNGIGFETARAIAKYANLVIITGYNAERLKLSEDAIKKSVPSANIRPLILDLCSLASVRNAAAEVNAYPEPLHVLIHNAAHGGGPFQLTPDGFESQLSTAHIGPFLLTKLLAPKLLSASSSKYTPRVVTISSIGHAHGTGVDLDFLAHPTAEKYTNQSGYFQAKSACILFAAEVGRRSGGRVIGFSLHPGAIYTNLMQKPENQTFMKSIGALKEDGTPNDTQFPFKNMAQGAATTVVAAFDPRIEDQPGSYLVDCVVANDQVAPHSSDPEMAKKLWDATEELLGEKFTF
ncbi:short-chain dehydrogenase/reductase family protein [Favolaschia claudopus]|uniref:Short-chain dehydrogenase/reductase family protein n=1 Tax=Favolaschia claudopus TaxID=2862362 RepID=A0AAW0DCS5_9AGAR